VSCPVFAGFTLAFVLQLRKKHGKTSVRVAIHKQIIRIHSHNNKKNINYPNNPDMHILTVWKCVQLFGNCRLAKKGPTCDSMCLTSPFRLVAIQGTVCFSPLLTPRRQQNQNQGVKRRHQRDNDGLDFSAHPRAAQSTTEKRISTSMEATYTISMLFRQVHKSR